MSASKVAGPLGQQILWRRKMAGSNDFILFENKTEAPLAEKDLGILIGFSVC